MHAIERPPLAYEAMKDFQLAVTHAPTGHWKIKEHQSVCLKHVKARSEDEDAVHARADHAPRNVQKRSACMLGMCFSCSLYFT